MNKTFTFLAIILFGSFIQAQQLENQTAFLNKDACLIEFKASPLNIDLEQFVRCYKPQVPVIAAQNSLQINQINFRKLPLLVPSQEFPTMQNSYRESFLRLGEYDNSFANAKTNNLAFFEANRNTVMGSAFVISPVGPQF